jgi:hypothetical protein
VPRKGYLLSELYIEEVAVIMTNNHTILHQQTAIIPSENEKPRMMTRQRGTLLLTSQRLIWIKESRGQQSYQRQEEYEHALTRKGGFEIPISQIKEVHSDTYYLTPYVSITYTTDSGTKAYSFIDANTEDMTLWFDAINNALKAHYTSSSTKTEGIRELIVIDQSHDQDDRGTTQIADVINTQCQRIGVGEPLALYGRPNNELLVTNEHLLPSTLLFISLGTKSSDKFSQKELTLLKSYVEHGGRLLLATCSPEKPPNELIDAFGAQFDTNVVTDEYHHAGRHKDHIIVGDLIDHPINQNVSTLRFGKFGCYPLRIQNPDGVTLASRSDHATPSRAPVAAILPHGKGHVVVIGQTRLFQDDFIDEADNRRWFENMLTYLTSPAPPPPTQLDATPAPQFCTQCGVKCAEGALFCSNCGAKIA